MTLGFYSYEMPLLCLFYVSGSGYVEKDDVCSGFGRDSDGNAPPNAPFSTWGS